MQNMVDNLSSYTEKNGMKINFDKTKSMIFNKSGRHLRRSFRVGKEIIHTTNNYKYLGFILTPSGEINTGLQDLKDRALRGKWVITLWSYPSTTLHLFDTLIKPILLYNSDYWGCLKLPKNNPIENMHMRFCKEILGVQRQTTNVGVLLELGRIPHNNLWYEKLYEKLLKNSYLGESQQTSTVSTPIVSKLCIEMDRRGKISIKQIWCR